MVKRKYEKFHDSKGLQEVCRALRAQVKADSQSVPEEHIKPRLKRQQPIAKPRSSSAKHEAKQPKAQLHPQDPRPAAGSEQSQHTTNAGALQTAHEYSTASESSRSGIGRAVIDDVAQRSSPDARGHNANPPAWCSVVSFGQGPSGYVRALMHASSML